MNSRNAPNFLFIMADQYRHDHLGVLGVHPVDTPNLDALANRGRLFTNCCTNAPVCAPARIALATGLHPERIGALDNSAYLPTSTPTYYQHLRDHDYRVGCVGKLDLAKDDPQNGLDGQRPSNFRWGFTHPLECEGKMHAGQCRPANGPYSAHLHKRGVLDAFCDDYENRRSQGYALAADDSVLEADDYEDGFIGNQSVKWLQDRPKDYPWHLFVSFVGPHDPYDPPKEYAERYRDIETVPAVPDSGTTRYTNKTEKKATPELIAHTRRQYIAEIKLLDDKIGEIIDAVKARGELDNTYIIFTSDHGEMLGDLNRFQKSVPYDGAMRIPLIIAGPGIEPGVSDTMVELFDLGPTISDLAGLPAMPNLDAKSLGPVLRGEADEHRDTAVSMLRGFQCIRSKTKKWIRYNAGSQEFYDLEADPHENNNLMGSKPEGLKELQDRLKDYIYKEAKWHR